VRVRVRARAAGGDPPTKDTHGCLSSGCTWRESLGPLAGRVLKVLITASRPPPPGRIYIRATRQNFCSASPTPLSPVARAQARSNSLPAGTRRHPRPGWQGVQTAPGWGGGVTALCGINSCTASLPFPPTTSPSSTARLHPCQPPRSCRKLTFPEIPYLSLCTHPPTSSHLSVSPWKTRARARTHTRTLFLLPPIDNPYGASLVPLNSTGV
jgi:hypothetical protein